MTCSIVPAGAYGLEFTVSITEAAVLILPDGEYYEPEHPDEVKCTFCNVQSLWYMCTESA